MSGNISHVLQIAADFAANATSERTASPTSDLNARVARARLSAALPTVQQSKDLVALKLKLLETRLATNRAVDGQANLGMWGSVGTVAAAAIVFPPAALFFGIGAAAWFTKSAIDKHFLEIERQHIETKRSSLVPSLGKDIFRQLCPDFVGNKEAEDAFIARFTTIWHNTNDDKREEAIQLLKNNFRYLDCIINESHYRNQEMLKIPDDIAAGVKVEELFDVYNTLNFTDEHGKYYVKQTSSTSRNMLQKIVNDINQSRPKVGTPEEGSAALDLFYRFIKKAITHTIKVLKEMPASDARQELVTRVMVDLLEAGDLCGGRLYAASYKAYVTAKRGAVPTFKEDILDVLATHRLHLVESLLPRGFHNVHTYNRMLGALGKELGLPGSDMMFNFAEIYRGSEFNINDTRNRFHELYTPENILNGCIKPYIEETSEMHEKLVDWFKKNTPDTWQQEKYQRIRKEVATLSSFQEQRAYLKSKEIYVLADQTIVEAIERDRTYSYFDQNVIDYAQMEDDTTKKLKSRMRYKASAIGDMLKKLGVFF